MHGCVIRRIQIAGHLQHEYFHQWKEVLEEQAIKVAITKSETYDWDLLWSVEKWDEADPGKVLGDLLLSNIMNEQRRIYTLIKRQEGWCLKRLNKEIGDLYSMGLGDDNLRVQSTIQKIEMINNIRAKERLAHAKEYVNIKKERITPEFLSSINTSREDGARLAEICDPLHSTGFGYRHADIIAECFQNKFSARKETKL